jgi:hypothetical protein
MTRAFRCAVQLTAIAALILICRALPVRATVGWLPISPADLALKDNPKEPGANAMILYRESVLDTRTTFSDGDTDQEYVRIKVFTQEGTKEGHVEIQYDKSWESIPYIAGRTILPDGTIKNFDGQVLDTTIVDVGGLKLSAKTFTLPDVQPGCIIEYKYTSQALPSYVHVERWVLSGKMYTREAHFTYYPYEGYGGLGLTPLYRTYLLPADAALKQQVNGSFTMSVQDIPAVMDEPLMPPKEVLEPRVEFYYAHPGDPGPSESKEKYWNYYAKKWDDEIEHFVGKKDALNAELAKIISPNDSPETKLRKIYDHVAQIRNLSMEDYKTQKEAKVQDIKQDNNVADVFKRGYATGHQINLAFIGLARAAGFDSTEVYVADRSSSIFVADRKDVDALTTDLVWVRAGSQEYYVDPSAGYYPFGILPWFETEAGGIRVDRHTATVVSTPEPVSNQATLVRTADLVVKQDGSVSGTIQIKFTGLEGAIKRVSERKEDQTGRTKDLEGEIKGWLPVGSNFKLTKISSWDDIEQPLEVDGTFTVGTYGATAARNLLLPLDLFQATQAGDFSQQSRQNAIYFSFPYEEIDDVTVHAPAGYRLNSLPKEQKINLGAALYEITPTGQGNTVEVKRHLSIKGVLFSKDAYPTFRAFFGAVRTDDDAQMVLENAQTGQLN